MAGIVTVKKIGPQQDGMRMSLSEFARVEGEPGYLYELDHGVIVVSDVPGVTHMLIVLWIRNALVFDQGANPGRIYAIAEGGCAAMRMPDMQSERHPDLSVYLTEPPPDDEQPWEYWTPDIAIEVVSPGSEERDYAIKREEYLEAGVRLYWIIDPLTRFATIQTRRGDTWDEQRVEASGKLMTRLLPGFELPLADVFSVIRSPQRPASRNGKPTRRRRK